MYGVFPKVKNLLDDFLRTLQDSNLGRAAFDVIARRCSKPTELRVRVKFWVLLAIDFCACSTRLVAALWNLYENTTAFHVVPPGLEPGTY